MDTTYIPVSPGTGAQGWCPPYGNHRRPTAGSLGITSGRTWRSERRKRRADTLGAIRRQVVLVARTRWQAAVRFPAAERGYTFQLEHRAVQRSSPIRATPIALMPGSRARESFQSTNGVFTGSASTTAFPGVPIRYESTCGLHNINLWGPRTASSPAPRGSNGNRRGFQSTNAAALGVEMATRELYNNDRQKINEAGRSADLSLSREPQRCARCTSPAMDP